MRNKMFLPTSEEIRRTIRSIIILFGLSALGGAAWQLIEQLCILKTWPEIKAEVTSSQLTSHVVTREEKIRDQDSEGSSSRPRTRTVRTTMYGAAINLRYTVNGQEYNTPTTAGYETSDSGMMQELVQRYAPGSRHPTRYDPSDPGKIRIEVSNTPFFFALPLILGAMGTVLLLISLLFRARAGSSPRTPRISMAMGMLGDMARGGPGRNPGYFTDRVHCPACRQQTLASQPACMHCGVALPPKAGDPKLKAKPQ